MQPYVCGPADTDGTRSNFPDPANRKNHVWGRKRVATQLAGSRNRGESGELQERRPLLYLEAQPAVPTTEGPPHAASVNGCNRFARV